MITAKINCSKIDKAKLFKGEKGTYLDIVLIESENDRFGNDYMIVQSTTKEGREAGVKGAILGSGKVVNRKPAATPPAQKPPAKAAENLDEDVPF